ncbi:uncharacterized protein J4E84_000145 [Alternaria hordeiaustralica]|uniref:uncharacterized protein n=1 Tax=Alternaria hordeiaustralica TaxID=1187925 RepID=UPI0020C36887|nr:uncharacterized protein J4E84_000145 [Alternaria hordeiaustralica]KAI4697021.1 hypothetical protein J4E84_000145 [Alternaria hordeiaustralica]
MSATNIAPNASDAVAVDSTNTNTPVDAKQEALKKIAAEKEAKRIENVAIQKKKLEAAKQKAAQELMSKGKNAVLKAQANRPSRRPAKKNRKPLPPPANRTHEIEATMEKTKASAEEKRLAPLRVVRPSYSYSDIVEQRVVDGVVKRITHTNRSVHEPCSAHVHGDGIDQRMADSVTEPTFQPADAPETAQSDTDVESDKVTEPDTESDEDAPQLVQELASPEQVTVPEDDDDFAEASSITALPHIYITAPTHDADEEPPMTEDLAEAIDTSSEPIMANVSEESTCSPSAILSMPNSTLYPSRLSRDEEAKLVALHVAPIVLPVAEAKQQKLSKAEKKAAKTSEASKEVATTKSDVVQKLPETDSVETTMDNVDPIVIAEEHTYVTTLLARPNGSGVTTESRDLHEKLAALHVAPPSLPVTSHKQQKIPTAKSKATKADQKKTVTIEEKEQDFVASLLSKSNSSGVPKESRDFHEKLVALHITPLSVPAIAPKQQKASKTKQKVIKLDKKKSVATEKKEPDFVASLLCKPNGPGETKETRDFHNSLVAIHVAPIEVPVPIQQDKDKKSEKANRYIETWTADPDAVDPLISSMVPPITEEPTPAVEELGTEDATRDEPSVVVATPIHGFWQTVLSKPTATEAATVEQTVIIPDSAPTTSSHDDSSSSPSSINPFRTRSRSSTHSTPSILRAASKARTTLLGGTSLETFITTLDFELWDGTTTKDDICEAFASLSTHPTPTITGLDTAKIQRKIKLGSTSLYAFLHQITFMEDDVTVVGEVMRVFRKAAREQVTETKLEVALWLAEETDEGEGRRRGRREERASMAGGV